MIFVRVAVNLERNEVIGVITEDVPHDAAAISTPGEACEMIDLGVVDDHEWKTLEGAPCSAAAHIRERLQAARVKPGDLREKRAAPELHVEGLNGLAAIAEVRAIQDAPCTLEGLRSRLREKGVAGVPVTVRAWLANVLPPHHVDALGIGRALPISAMKAAEALRNRRDPHGGSRMAVLERIAQKQSDAVSAARLRARTRRA